MEAWTVKVLHSRYCFLPHLLPPVLREPFEFPIESLKIKIIDKNNGNFNDLNDWKQILKCRVNMQSSHTLEHFRYGIDTRLLDKQIDIAHKHFVITTVDKADNNFAFICKQIYISKIKEELGIRGGRIEGNDVYACCIGSSPQKIVDNQCIQ